MRPTLLLAAHGTRDPAGLVTTAELAAAIAAARPAVPVSVCFLDVASPSLPDALDALGSSPAVVVPLLLSAGYHVTTDIPQAVAGRGSVAVARHLGPDPVLVDVLADRLGGAPGTVLLAAIASSRSSARAEVDEAARLLSGRLGRPVTVLPLSGSPDLTPFEPPLAVAAYLLAEGGFLTTLRAAVDGRGVVTEPFGVDPALVSLVWSRYDEAGGMTRPRSTNEAEGVR